MFKWIVVLVILGTLAMIFIWRVALKDVDKIYDDAGYPKEGRFLKEHGNK